MTRMELLQDRLEHAFRGSKYHSFLSSIKGLTEEDAQWAPPHYRGFPHMNGSILNLAFHTGGDKFVLMSCAFTGGALTWKAVQDKFDQRGGNLAAAKALAEEGHALVLDTLRSLSDEELDVPRPYYGGKTHTAFELFGIVAEHDLYHAGQINFVRCLLAGLKVG
jgi:hypothetical protein